MNLKSRNIFLIRHGLEKHYSRGLCSRTEGEKQERTELQTETEGCEQSAEGLQQTAKNYMVGIRSHAVRATRGPTVNWNNTGIGWYYIGDQWARTRDGGQDK